MKKYSSEKRYKNRRRSGKRVRIANKLRFTAFILLCFILFASAAGMFKSAVASRDRETYVLTISKGDTLWDIAEENNTLGKDTRSVMDDIVKLNHLTTTALKTGDELLIPIY